MSVRSPLSRGRIPFSTRKSRILHLVRERGKLSRVDISEECGLEKKSVSVAVDELIGDGLLAPAGRQESSAGRRQELLALKGGRGNFIGIDLGGTHVIGTLADLTARVLDRVFFEIRPGLPAGIILDQMRMICGSLASSAKASAEILSIGICVPGFINPATGVSIRAENIPGWCDVPVKAVFEREFGRPVYTEDCSRAFGIAERWFGHGRGRNDFVFLDLGYGIGMAIFTESRFHFGCSCKSGEIGHTIVEPGGRGSVCGNRGCLETVASGKAIARDAAAGMGDPYACGLLERAGFYVGLALGNAASILNPSAVILGGGLVVSNKVMIESIDGSALGSRTLAMNAIFDRLS